MLKYLLLLSFCVIAIAQDYDEYGEEYFYQDYYDEEYPYDYNDGIDDYKVVIPSTTTQRPTTTTRRPYYYTTRRTTTKRTTTRPPYYYTTTTSRPTRPPATRTTRMPPKRFMPGRTRNTVTQTTARPSTNDLSATVEPGMDITTEFKKPDQDEYGNKLVYYGYRKEDYFCPEGYVLDIYGYCRAIFYEEKRDWHWWTNIRNYVLGVYNSGYQSSY